MAPKNHLYWDFSCPKQRYRTSIWLERNDTYEKPEGQWEHLDKKSIRDRIEAAIPSVGRIELPDEDIPTRRAVRQPGKLERMMVIAELDSSLAACLAGSIAAASEHL